MRKRVSILGATGSVGQSTVDLILRNPNSFEVIAVTAGSNAEKLADIARRTGAQFAAIADEAHLPALRDALSGSGIEVGAGPFALGEAACRDADLVVAAIVGCAGLEPMMAAVEAGRTIAVANKEALVTAGALVSDSARRNGATLLPIDSEHNAIFQCLAGQDCERVERLVLTASGGPFREWTRERMASATPAQAVAHPNWSMGAKISVDSATMMNKGLELIEAHHLFALAPDRIEILVHPQSVIHSMVEFVDGSVLAQLGTPDMRIPISHALAWPERMATPADRLDLLQAGPLTFEQPDEQRFPALRLARDALAAGAAMPIVLNAANEIAVEAFLKKRIGFLEIADTVAKALNSHADTGKPQSIDEVIDLDRATRQKVADSLPEYAS